MGDEEFYLKATNEVEAGKKDPALWAKVMAIADGDQKRAKYEYIKLRVAQLAKKEGKGKPTLDKHLPVEAFAENHGLTPDKVMEKLSNGIYEGKQINGKWYISSGAHRKKTYLTLFYYLIGISLGILIAITSLHSSILTTYYLFGEPIKPHALTYEQFDKHLTEIKTSTVVDYDGIVSFIVGAPTEYFPSFKVDGDIGTPNSINMLFIATHVVVMVVIFWLLKLAVTRMRHPAKQSTSPGW